MIAVHAGAGYHAYVTDYISVCKRACREGLQALVEGSALTGACRAIEVLENDSCTNAGFGSNLNLEGKVECDASIMTGDSSFGAIGAVAGVKNPINVAAKLLLEERKGTMSLGRVAPLFLVGDGARQYAKSYSLEIINPLDLITGDSMSCYLKYKKALDAAESMSQSPVYHCKPDGFAESDHRLDTVGAVCVDSHHCMSAGTSSGGILLKLPGRVGQAAVFGSGCWAVNPNDDDDHLPGVACSSTGIGEQLIKALMAMSCAKAVRRNSHSPTDALKHAFSDAFVGQCDDHLSQAGVVLLQYDSPVAELLWIHSTQTMCIGYMSIQDTKPKALISKGKKGSLTIGGAVRRLQPSCLQ
ncbi:threonine aspartase 1-like [Corticium candelabrum]|uniref:threonine aspartase 1-like n=1 Tax=Corticium candelabrum TaxID=121492 RepID=UPI002E25810E|nr:threonine aspartase 1-like [Corticium candelabrum]